MSIIGSILGDIAGSQFEFFKPKDFNSETTELFTDKCRYTDDTVMTLATKMAIIDNISFSEAYQKYGRKYADAGYGGFFMNWLYEDNPQPYNSYGNGSAMRVSYVADYYNTLSDVEKYARLSAECTHNHPEGIKGSVVTATCIWMAKNGCSKEDILKYVNHQYPRTDYFSAEKTLDEIRKGYRWNETCEGSVPVAIRCVYEADSYVSFIRNVLSINCDTDTLCAIGGSVAEELFGGTGLNNDELLKRYLPDELLTLVYLK